MQNKIDNWLEYCHRYYTFRTYRQYHYVLRMFYNFCNTYPTYNDIVKYSNYMKQRHTNRTINNQLMILRSFCRWQKSENGCDNPLERFRLLPELPPRQRILTEEEYHTILLSCTTFESDIIRFLGNTGLRVSEFLAISPSWISSCKTHLKVLGKGNKERIVPLNRTCLEILSRHPNCHIAHTHCIWYICQALARRAGVPGFGPHALRHMFATRMIRAGVPILQVSQILGHSSVLITQKIYVHLLPADYIGVTDRLPD